MSSVLPVRWHPALYAALAVAGVAYWAVTRRGSLRATSRERWRFVAGIAVLLVAYGWPLGDLAEHVSLSALVLQRLLVLLAAAPLLMTAFPADLVAMVTRPAPIDRVLVACSHPAAAVLVVTIVGTVSLTPAVVAWSTAATVQNVLFALVNLALGIILWLPVLSIVPGTHHLSNAGKGVYLLVSSLVVTALSIVWIFAQHPLYSSFHHQQAALGISPIVDQQLAGFVAKIGAYGPMWALAFVLLARTGGDGSSGSQHLRWVDVQRELERSARRPGQNTEMHQ